MDNYIVRIYRRDNRYPDKIAGLVEIIEAEEEKAFNTYDELREILRFSSDAAHGEERRGGPAKTRSDRTTAARKRK